MGEQLNFDQLATEIIKELDVYADEVVEYCRTHGLDEDKIWDMSITKGEENPVKREFLGIELTYERHPLGEGINVSYSFSEMLGKRGIEKNRVVPSERRPEYQKSLELANEIDKQLKKLAANTKDKSYSGGRLVGRLYETLNGLYYLDYSWGNPFGDYKYEPHFVLSKKLTLKPKN